MRKLLAVVLAAAAVSVAPAWAHDYFGPQPVAGFGLTVKENGNGSVPVHLGTGFTMLSLDEKGIVGLCGLGFNAEFVRDTEIPPPYQRADEIKFLLTFIPIRVGPLSYEFSLSKHVRAFGHDRGRVHVIKLDIPGLIRTIKAAP